MFIIFLKTIPALEGATVTSERYLMKECPVNHWYRAIAAGYNLSGGLQAAHTGGGSQKVRHTSFMQL